MNYEKIIPVYNNKPFIVITTTGYNYDWLQNLFLSSYNVTFPSLTSIDKHTNIRRVSAICPQFTGYLLPLSTYSVINRNTLYIDLSAIHFIGEGNIDVIFENVAGYTKLTDKNTIIQYIEL
jgi:hypothetical protein